MLTQRKYSLRRVALFGRDGIGSYLSRCELDAMAVPLHRTSVHLDWCGGMLVRISGPWPANQRSADVRGREE